MEGFNGWVRPLEDSCINEGLKTKVGAARGLWVKRLTLAYLVNIQSLGARFGKSIKIITSSSGKPRGVSLRIRSFVFGKTNWARIELILLESNPNADSHCPPFVRVPETTSPKNYRLRQRSGLGLIGACGMSRYGTQRKIKSSLWLLK